LALIALTGALDCILKVGVGKDDHRRFATQLQSAGLQCLGRVAQHLFGGRPAADELDLVDAGMPDHRLADGWPAGDDVEHTIRKSSFYE